MANIVKGQIGNALESVAPDHTVATADGIYDETAGKYQDTINAETAQNLSGLHHGTGYYECDTAAATAAKTVIDEGYQLPELAPYGGSMKIKFDHANTAANPTLSISGCTAKPLYYDGAIASSSNTWADGETVEVYYDGTNFQANNVAGGGNFATGQKVRETGIDDTPTSGSKNLVKSGGVYNIVSIKAYKKTGKNLLDLHDINYLEHSNVNFYTGNIIYREGTDLSGYISVEAGKTYHISNMYDESINLVPIGNTIGIACYNSNLEFLEALTSALNFTIPQNAAYIRVSIDRTQLNNLPMVEEGSARTAYEPFCGVGGDEGITNIKRRLQLTSADISIIPYPAREPYTQEISGYFKGYTVSLDGMYEEGIRGVLFLGSNFTLDSNIRCGVTLDENGDIVDVAMGTVAQTSDWYLLPVTAETKLLHATYCINSKGGTVVNPTRVIMLDVKTYEAIIRTLEITSLSEQVGLLLEEIYGTQQTARTYTFLGDGNFHALNPPIGVNDKITAFSDTVPRLALYTTGDDNNPTHVYPTDLPFAVDKKYVGVRCYHQDRPTVTINVEPVGSNGLKAIVEQLQEEIDGVNKLPDTFLPKKIYGVIGDTMQIYNRGVTISQEPNRYYNDWECGQGKIYKRYLEITPALSNGSIPTGLTIKHRLIDDHYNKTVQKSSSFVVSARPSSPSNQINVLCVGASTTQNGEWASELKRRLTDTFGSGTPAADGLTNITFVGRKNLAASWNRPVAVNVEATGGWQWSTFYTPQAAMRFVVSGVTSVNIGDVYSYVNANNETVKVAVAEVNITGSSGNIRFTYNWDTAGHGDPSAASGTITKVSGSGDATIAYSSAESETYCPFYNDETGQPDFSVYAETYCNNQIDVVIFNLGNINAGVMGDESLVALIASMKTMLDALHADFPNCKVIIAPGIGYSTYYGLEYNYNASSKYKSWAALYAQFRYAKAVEDFIGDNEYKDWCFLANTMAETDSEYAFPISTKAVNTRMPDVKEVIGTNGAHPNDTGYMMIADSIYRAFVNEVLTNNN